MDSETSDTASDVPVPAEKRQRVDWSEGGAFIGPLRRGEDEAPIKGVFYMNDGRSKPWHAQWYEDGKRGCECFARASLANARKLGKNRKAVRRICEGGSCLITCSMLDMVEMPAPTHIMPWDFDDIVENAKTKGYLYYKEHEMPLLGLASSGNIVEKAVKRFLSSSFEVRDAKSGSCVNGTHRSANSKENDFILVQNNIEKRTEVKTTLLHWNNADSFWTTQFAAVKPNLHDMLILVVVDVDRLHIFQRDVNCTTGNSSNGVSTDSVGHNIRVGASASTPEFSDALEHICKSLKEQGELLGCVKFDDKSYKDIFTTRTAGDKAYVNIPFAGLHMSTRGDVAEAVVRSVHSRHLPKYHYVIDAASGTCCNGTARGRSATSHDFGVQLPNDEALKIEMKSCLLYRERDLWVADFQNVKFDEFDVLLLALTTPRAIHVIKYNVTRRPFVTTTGKSVRGNTISISGRSHADILTSADDILKKLTLCGCEYLYRIDF
tara:strand:- start:623 stop:2098 length:1476 start_codon:yes stop_codon:yes gene_type:complete